MDLKNTFDNAEVLLFLKESNAIEGVFDDKALEQSFAAWEFFILQDKITPTNILKLHTILMKGKLVKKWLGKFRTVNVSIGKHEIVGITDDKIMWKFKKTGEGLPWRSVKKALGDWVEMANLTVKLPMESVFNSPEKMDGEIRQDHVVFEGIHPFVDGNGRVGRILMNWQRLKVGLPILIIKNDEKQEYYKWFKK